MNKLTIGGVFGILLSVPIFLILMVAFIFLAGFFGYALGWSMEYLAHPMIYSALDVIPTQPFSRGDLPKIMAILMTLIGVFSLKGIGGSVYND